MSEENQCQRKKVPDRKVEVLDYDPQWANDFENEALLLGNLIGENAINIEHIGSTSVAGLCAKPIIDVLIEVSCLQALDSKNAEMEAAGYRARGENGIVGRRYFDKGGNERTHHAHVFMTGDTNLIRHRAFKHYLIAHPEALKEYAEVKKQAVAKCNNDIKVYISLKNDFIQTHEALAIEWYEQLAPTQSYTP